MRMTAVVLLPLWLAFSPARADDASPPEAGVPPRAQAAMTLEEANRAFEESRLAEAASGYQELLRRFPGSSTLNYNLGNAYYRLGTPGSLGRAIAAYQRAFETNPRDSDIRHNLDFALRNAGDQLAPTETPWALFIIFHFLSRAELLALQWLCLWSALLLASLYLVRENAQTGLRPWLLAAISSWAFFIGWWSLRTAGSPHAPAVVVTPNAEVRSGPGDNFPVSFKVPEGRRVSQLESKGDWIEIGVLKEGLKGWIAAGGVEPI